MTYLQLVNKVLVRLREDEIDGNASNPSGFLTDPFYKTIGAHINDAKDMVEDSWQWGALRGTDSFSLDQVGVQVSGQDIALPNSVDSSYVLKGIRVYPNATASATATGIRSNLTWIAPVMMQSRYADYSQVPTSCPYEFAVTGTAGTTGLNPFGSTVVEQLKCTLYPIPTDGTYWVEVSRVAHQAELSLPSDIIKVPSLPVYALATALASRERGEVGGAPTSALFTTAERHLSDAIAYDSALYGSELDWYANDREFNTNVRFA